MYKTVSCSTLPRYANARLTAPKKRILLVIRSRRINYKSKCLCNYISEHCVRVLFLDIAKRYPGNNPPKSERCRESFKNRSLRNRMQLHFITVITCGNISLVTMPLQLPTAKTIARDVLPMCRNKFGSVD